MPSIVLFGEEKPPRSAHALAPSVEARNSTNALTAGVSLKVVIESPPPTTVFGEESSTVGNGNSS